LVPAFLGAFPLLRRAPLSPRPIARLRRLRKASVTARWGAFAAWQVLEGYDKERTSVIFNLELCQDVARKIAFLVFSLHKKTELHDVAIRN
jgi:hypothetical protein